MHFLIQKLKQDAEEANVNLTVMELGLKNENMKYKYITFDQRIRRVLNFNLESNLLKRLRTLEYITKLE